jgi:flagellar protein FlgJ
MVDVNIIPPNMQAMLVTADQQQFENPAENDDLRAAAEKFEAIFLNEFLKQARKTKLAEDLFGSSAKTTYEEMLDREYADNLSDKINLGIADALVRQLGGRVK